VEKVVHTWALYDPNDPNDDNWSATPSLHKRWIWHDWLCVMEYDVSAGPTLTAAKKYTWGLDLGGSGDNPRIDSAGGIGGLLAVRDAAANPAKSYYYFYDGNGNVGQVIDRADGSVDAKYEYDAYGNYLTKSGTFANENPWRFSTKYWDDETDLGYWGYRYYDPDTGRWATRDPIGEARGPDLLTYANNSPITSYDGLGLAPCQAHWNFSLHQLSISELDMSISVRTSCCMCDSVFFVQSVYEEYKSVDTLGLTHVSLDWQWDDYSLNAWGHPIKYVKQYENKNSRNGCSRINSASDMPGASRWILGRYFYFKQEFETCALCGYRDEAGQWKSCVLGCIGWGHSLSRHFDTYPTGDGAVHLRSHWTHDYWSDSSVGGPSQRMLDKLTTLFPWLTASCSRDLGCCEETTDASVDSGDVSD